jgi:D-3-phosphoglycerate dehydrogenase
MSQADDRKELPTVFFADRPYMTAEAIDGLQRVGKVMWIHCDSEDELVEKVHRANPKIIVSEYFKITARVMDSSSALKGIMVWGVGYDHIDVDAASARGIYVANTRGSNADSVAEHTVALVLALSRRLPQAYAFVRNGGWTKREEEGLPPELTAHNLSSKSLGIVGLGAVGCRVARIAHGIGMSVLAYDPYVDAETAEERGAELVDLERLLTESDFITLHVTLTDETRRMIGTKELDMMKPTAYLINTSRGAAIDETALVRTLREKKIAGAGLDVFESEPLTAENALLKLDNVILTPHSAGNSKEALEATSRVIGEEVTRMLCGQAPKNLVNRLTLTKRGYLCTK